MRSNLNNLASPLSRNLILYSYQDTLTNMVIDLFQQVVGIISSKDGSVVDGCIVWQEHDYFSFSVTQCAYDLIQGLLFTNNQIFAARTKYDGVSITEITIYSYTGTIL